MFFIRAGLFDYFLFSLLLMIKQQTSDSVFGLQESSGDSKKEQCPQISIDNRYYFKSLLTHCGSYIMYKGIDTQKYQWVHIYSKRGDSIQKYSSHIKENVRNQVCPKILWAGEIKSSKLIYFFQVHEKYGPSLKTMFTTLRRSLREMELLHLLLELVKLVEKMNTMKIVSGKLEPDSIVFDPSPLRNDLFLLNSFSLKKRHSVMKPQSTKYCSRGVHLGRSINIKDDLQSICYILVDLFLGGKFLADKSVFEYEEVKLSGKIDLLAEGFPKIFVQFYYYVISLNLNDEINFFAWKTNLTKLLSNEYILKPYSFMPLKRISNSSTQLQIKEEDKELQLISTIIQINQDQMVEQNQNEKQRRTQRIQKYQLQIDTAKQSRRIC